MDVYWKRQPTYRWLIDLVALLPQSSFSRVEDASRRRVGRVEEEHGNSQTHGDDAFALKYTKITISLRMKGSELLRTKKILRHAESKLPTGGTERKPDDSRPAKACEIPAASSMKEAIRVASSCRL